MYGMVKTTLYLPESLKGALARRAQIEGRSEADIVREAVEAALAPYQGVEPTLPLFSSADLTSERTEDLLSDFGVR
jgi:plasmid stability protein